MPQDARPRRCWALLAALVAALGLFSLAVAQPSLAGPPFETDDPDPVECHHLEVDVAQAHQGEPAVTGPIWEVDYGPTKNVEVSVGGQPGETGLASAIRLLPETRYTPEVGFLPSLIVKSNGETETFLPFWAQKTIKNWTIFGGGGVSHGAEFTGITVMRNSRSGSGVGLEFYHESERSPIVPSAPRLAVGYIDQLAPSRALLFWAGRQLQPNPGYFLAIGFQVVIAPKGHASNCQ